MVIKADSTIILVETPIYQTSTPLIDSSAGVPRDEATSVSPIIISGCGGINSHLSLCSSTELRENNKI